MIGSEEDRRKYKMCLSRKRFADRASALESGERAGPSGAYKAYRCPICQGYHLTLTPEEKERRIRLLEEREKREAEAAAKPPEVGMVYTREIDGKLQQRLVQAVEPVGATHLVHWSKPCGLRNRRASLEAWAKWATGATVEAKKQPNEEQEGG